MSTSGNMRASTSSSHEPLSFVEYNGDSDAQAEVSQDEKEEAPSDEPPPLGSYITKDPDEKLDALKLVADGVAQMRQTAGRTLIFHPLNMAVFFAFSAVLVQYMRSSKGKFSDVWLIWSTMAGVLMSALITVRMFTGPYLQAAETVKEELVFGADVFITKFGSEIIGTCIMIVVPTESKKNQKRKTNRAIIRGWAVRLRYRGKGVGTALLEEAVAEAKKRGCDEIEFAEDHPSKLVERLSTLILANTAQTQPESFGTSTTVLLTGKREERIRPFRPHGRTLQRARRDRYMCFWSYRSNWIYPGVWLPQ